MPSSCVYCTWLALMVCTPALTISFNPSGSNYLALSDSRMILEIVLFWLNANRVRLFFSDSVTRKTIRSVLGWFVIYCTRCLRKWLIWFLVVALNSKNINIPKIVAWRIYLDFVNGCFHIVHWLLCTLSLSIIGQCGLPNDDRSCILDLNFKESTFKINLVVSDTWYIFPLTIWQDSKNVYWWLMWLAVLSFNQ